MERILDESLKINMRHYHDVYRKHPCTERYCFPLRRFLGHHGLYENHPLKGRIFTDNETGREWSVDDVYVHWYDGWYFVALARNSENSHSSITWNINSSTGDNIEHYTLRGLPFNFTV